MWESIKQGSITPGTFLQLEKLNILIIEEICYQCELIELFANHHRKHSSGEQSRIENM